MSDWITASGDAETSTSNLTHADTPPAAKNSSGRKGIEVRTSFETGKSTIHTSQGSEYNADVASDYQGSVIGTARTEGGSLIMNRPLTSSDRVTLPCGSTTNISAAIYAGFLTRNPDGSFSDVQTTEALRNPAEEALKNTPEAGLKKTGEQAEVFSIGDEAERTMTELTESVAHGDAIKAMDEVFQLGGVSDATLARMASTAGLEPDQMQAKFHEVHQGFYDAATSHLAAHGVTNEEAFEVFVGDNPQLAQKLTEGARDLVMSNDPKGLTGVADAFLEQLDRYASEDVKAALDEAGYGYEEGPNGRLMVQIDGYPVSWNVTVRQELIRFS